MKVQLKKEVFTKFHPNLEIAFIFAEDIDNSSKVKESLHLLKEVEKLVRLTFNKESIKSHGLIKPWKVAQKEFGFWAKHYCTSAERLLHLVIAKKSTASKDTLANLLHYLSLKYIVPFGADDLDRVHGGLTFDLAKGKEKVNLFYKLKKGAFYYHDSKNILGIKLDYWKNPKTALSSKTKSALIHFEILPPLDQKKQEALLKEAAGLIRTFCNGKVKVFVLDKRKSSVRF